MFDIFLGNVVEIEIPVLDVADGHRFVDHEGNRKILAAVELLGDYPRADRVAVEADHQVQDRGPVGNLDDPLDVVDGDDLFGKKEGVVALVEDTAGIFVKHVQGNLLKASQGMVLMEIDMKGALHQGDELEIGFTQDLVYDPLVVGGGVDDPQVRLEVLDIVDHIPGPGLENGELVLVE